MDKIVKTIVRAFRKGNKLLIFGCGGSAATASHFAAEFIGKGLPAISLTDSSIITALANDFGFDEVFARQIDALGKKEDVVIALSTSGKSQAVLQGITMARVKGLKVIDWPRNRKKNNDIDTARIQEYQLKLIHDVYLEVVRKMQ